MTIEEVNTRTRESDFINLPDKIYSGYPNWIRPLSYDIRAVFNPKQNPYFSHGECVRWIVREGPEVRGRIAAFIDHKTALKNDQPTGGIGFFEAVDDLKVSTILFEKARHWLKARKMEAMDGPVNFGERDKWWGLLVDGYDHEPNYCVNYNPPYYKRLFEHYGFQEYYKQFTYYRTLSGDIDEIIKERADRLTRKGNYSFTHIEKMPLKKVAKDFQEVYNKAWSSYPDVVPMDKQQVDALLKQIKPIMDRKLIWFGYYRDLPIAFAIMLPEVNQVFKYMNGKFGWFQQLKFAWLLRQGICTKILGVAFGIVPRFQRKGVESALIGAISKLAFSEEKTFRYKDIEHNWVGDFNPQMMHVHEMMGGAIRKTHATYRYLFDQTKPFKRAPEVGMK
ncbi:MAG: hypothetical protein KDC99_17245 [Cyclobacteriaceae bacterium]|nr:hypothetical protein [Cyclobacteriaceae bacterium]